MRKIGFVVVALILLFPLVAPALTHQPSAPEKVNEAVDPPQELLKYYWKLRMANMGDLISLLYPGWPPVAFFRYCDELVAHTTGRIGDEYSMMARDYIENEVLLPLARSAGFTGRASDLQKLDLEAKRELTELFFSYCANEIKFPSVVAPKKALLALALTPLSMMAFGSSIFDPSEEMDLWRFADFEILDLFPILFAIKSPVEVAYYRTSNCMGKSLMLASLLEMIGLEVGFGYIGAQLIYTELGKRGYPVPDSTRYIPAAGHAFVMLKDPGWGIGKWETGNEEAIKIVTGEDGEPIRGYLPSKDMMGTRMSGVYLLLDATYRDGFNPVLSPVAEDPDSEQWMELEPEDLTFAMLPAPEISPEVASPLPHLLKLGSFISDRLKFPRIMEIESDTGPQGFEKSFISAIGMTPFAIATSINIGTSLLIGVLIASVVGMHFFITGLREGRIDLIGPLVGALIGGASWAFIFFVLMQIVMPMALFLLFS